MLGGGLTPNQGLEETLERLHMFVEPYKIAGLKRYTIFAELGSTFAATVTNRPLECAHIVGTLLRDLGTDAVLWGTDSLLWGNPQWQIDAFRSPTQAKYAKMTSAEEIAREHALQKTYQTIWLPPPVKHSPWED